MSSSTDRTHSRLWCWLRRSHAWDGTEFPAVMACTRCGARRVEPRASDWIRGFEAAIAWRDQVLAAYSDPDRCGSPSNRPDYPYACIKTRGHHGDHGYAGVFWPAERTDPPASLEDAWSFRPCADVSRAEFEAGRDE